MEFKILKEIENPLFDRKEIEGEIRAEITPSREEVKEIVSKKFSIQPECIKIKGIRGKFGSRDFSIILNIYSSKEEKDKIEIKKKKEIEEEKKILELEKDKNQSKKEEITNESGTKDEEDQVKEEKENQIKEEDK
jgi:ribosomal protein S24E